MKDSYTVEELLDNNDEDIKCYTIQSYLGRVAQSADNKIKIMKWLSASYVITLVVLFVCYPSSSLWALMILDIFIAPGTMLLLLGFYSFFPSSHRTIKLGLEYQKVTAIITDQRRELKQRPDPEGGVSYEVTHYTIFDCTHDGIHYKFKSYTSQTSARGSEIGNKKNIYLNSSSPEMSILEDELRYAENGSFGSSLFLFLFGLVWVGMFVLKAFLD